MRALYILIFVIFTLNSCKKNEVKLQEIEFKNFKDWWTYYTKEIKLSKDFIALNSKNNEISKKQFLDSLNTGEYLPIKLKKENETYFLQKNKTNDVSIISTIKQVAETQLSVSYTHLDVYKRQVQIYSICFIRRKFFLKKITVEIILQNQQRLMLL